MKKATMFIAGVLFLLLSSHSNAELSLQAVLDSITIGGSSSIDVSTDALSDMDDSLWQMTGSGIGVNALVVECAGYAGTNKFGIYDMYDKDVKVEIFDGAAGAGEKVIISIMNGDVYVGNVFSGIKDSEIDFATNSFGFYLDSSDGDGGGIWYSDTDKNKDGMDHMLAFQGKGDIVQVGATVGPWIEDEYILAFEDLSQRCSDNDYNDFVVMTPSITNVPQPATMVLLGLGGVLLQKRRKQK